MSLSHIAAALSDSQLVGNLNRINAELDEWAGAGIEPTSLAFARETMVRDALRAEYRSRTGEVI